MNIDEPEIDREMYELMEAPECIVYDVTREDPYNDQEPWKTKTLPVKVHDDGSLTIEDWCETGEYERQEIRERHDIRNEMIE
ncbi:MULTISPECIES: hypothetical protein [Haloarcula]|uniref:hypothetical protein n=1 Tax=Haloarcula TaxID=2237 RepID=UPI0023E799A0|nr:hypothetical protein [Halomicroarcula sp. SHR3]